MAFILLSLPAFYLVSELRWILGPIFKNFVDYRKAFKALIISFVVWNSKLTRMLQNADSVRVASVLIAAIKCSMSYRPILTANIGLVDTNFDILHLELWEIWQGHIRSVEEFRQHISIQLFLVFIVCFNIDTLHVVGVRTAATIIWSLGDRSLNLLRSLLCFRFCHRLRWLL